MNLNQLEYFISVAETLSFTKAAQRCYISQTAMTQQIKALESTVGVPLLIRDKHHVELTNAGKTFLKEARVIIDRCQKALKLARTSASGIEGKITIGFISGYGQSEFIDVVQAFHRLYPNIQISLVKGNMSILFEKMEKGECDVIFTISPYRQIYNEYEHVYLHTYPLLVALSASNPLSSKKDLIYSQLENEDFIIMQPYRRAKDEAEESMLIYDRGGFFPNIVSMEGDPEVLLTMISIGLGISILPEYVIRLSQKNPNLAFLPLLREDGTKETMDVELSYPKDNYNPAIDHLLEIIKNK
ncbi:MAG: LysR family transcriptional regulator [Holdemanella sp.]|nr:LysR family transcriptional regulator [Holdemanella sp.]